MNYDGESTTYASEISPNVSTSFNSIRNIVKTIREKGMGIAAICGRIILDSTVVNEADFKEICRKVLNVDGTREVGFRLELINNKIVLTEYPSEAHERVSGVFDTIITSRFNVGWEIPFSPTRSTRWNFGVSSVEADSSFVNRNVAPNARQLDLNGRQLPDIIFEVGKTQNYNDLFSRPDIYFSLPGVKAVVLVKLGNSTVGDLIDQMVAVVYRRDGNGVAGPRAAVSFGRRLHPQTENAILRHSGIDPALFTGTGRHGIDEQCLQPGLPIFNMQVLEAARVWENVPVDQVPVIQTDVMMDVFFFRATLVSANLAN